MARPSHQIYPSLFFKIFVARSRVYFCFQEIDDNLHLIDNCCWINSPLASAMLARARCCLSCRLYQLPCRWLKALRDVSKKKISLDS